MKCPKQGCKGTDIRKSNLVNGWLFCPDCQKMSEDKNFIPLPKKEIEPEQKIEEELQDSYTYTECEYHPKYGGKRSPRTDCSICWQVYLHFHPEKREIDYESLSKNNK